MRAKFRSRRLPNGDLELECSPDVAVSMKLEERYVDEHVGVAREQMMKRLEEVMFGRLEKRMAQLELELTQAGVEVPDWPGVVHLELGNVPVD
jgi:hypothetical protein